MKKIGFIGAFDKTDLVIYISKLLTEIHKRILVVDKTCLEKIRYVVPAINPSQTYITEYEGVDFAVGFETIEDIKKYLAVPRLNYDFLILDIDSAQAYQQMKAIENDKNFFVTAFDNFSLKKGLEILGRSQDKAIMSKVLFSREMSQDEDDYLNFLSFYYAIQWNGIEIYFPYDIGDSTAIIEGQRAAKIKFKFLSEEYKNGLELLAQNIEPNVNRMEIRKILRTI